MGDYEGAKRASENAKGFSIAAIVVGIFILAINVIMRVVIITQN